MRLLDSIYSAACNKCPRCHRGDVFTEKNPYKLGKMFSMHRRCSHCGLTYEKEVSFFYGAMYISYGLMVGWFILWYLLQNTWLNWPLGYFMLFVTTTILFFSPLNLRLSRLLWLNIFFRYDKKLAELNS
jgi:uncharacterized protein (DUF983 family)